MSVCLRGLYAQNFRAKLPKRLLMLTSQLEAASDPSLVPDPDRFRDDLLRLLPDLKRFARSITRAADQTDDLVQETLLRAWQSQDQYRPGSDLKAWAFAIMRNGFYAQRRNGTRELPDADESAAG
ncbi:sigma factor [Methylobacterium sp. P31]